MFSKKHPKLKGTLSARLTLWYAGIFTISSLLTLGAIYYRVSAITIETLDSELTEEFEEMAAEMDTGGIRRIKAEIVEEIEEEKDQMFFSLQTVKGEVIIPPYAKYWGRLELPQHLTTAEGYGFKTLDISDHEHPVRLISGKIGPDAVLYIGISLEEIDEFLEVFRDLFILLLAPLIIAAAFVGWFMSRRALSGVEEVTRTAEEITRGAYGKRVQVKRHSHEVDKLANAFNTMLDRIQALLKGMRDITDNIAHDLRSPLTRIRGLAEMTLISNKPIDDYKEMAADTVEECDTLIEMINTMLDITEIEAGVGESIMEKVNLTSLIHQACELFRPTAVEKKIDIIENLEPDLTIMGDRHMLQRLITNILENAIKYTPQEGRVTISARVRSGQVEIVFNDTGIGISPDDLPRIFDRFYRSDRSRSQPGTGLGLSLVKAILKTLDGNITVDSIKTKGSTFTVTMPLCG